MKPLKSFLLCCERVNRCVDSVYVHKRWLHFFFSLFILLSEVSFLYPPYHLIQLCVCWPWIRGNKNKDELSGWGSHGKAWHIWNDIFTLFSPIYSSFGGFFFFRHVILYSSLCFFCWINKKSAENYKASTGVTARLDTFGLICEIK